MPDLKDQLIVALDVETLEKAQAIVDKLRGAVRFFKIGSQLFTAYGPEAVTTIAEKGSKIFLDLKFYDIPNTVFASVCSSTALGFIEVPSSKDLGMFELGHVFMVTVHAQGGFDMMKKAAQGAAETARELNIKRPYIIGVTVLTSEGQEEDTANIVLGRAKLAKEAGLDGVVCSAYEASVVRQACGENFIIVTPGIRAVGAVSDDQKRKATARQAIEAGANFIVVGRPIIEAKDPLKAVQDLLN